MIKNRAEELSHGRMVDRMMDSGTEEKWMGLEYTITKMVIKDMENG